MNVGTLALRNTNLQPAASCDHVAAQGMHSCMITTQGMPGINWAEAHHRLLSYFVPFLQEGSFVADRNIRMAATYWRIVWPV